MISYSGTFEGTGNSAVGITGWTRNPLVEYFIIENYSASFQPNCALNATQHKGQLTAEGSTYDLYMAFRTDDGPAVYLAVRRERRSAGKVDVGVFFGGWERAGMALGKGMEYQVVACEASYYAESRGRCEFTVLGEAY